MSVYLWVFVFISTFLCVCVFTCSLCIKNHKQTKLSFYTPGQCFTLLDNELAGDLCAAIFSGTYILLTHQQVKNDT